MAEPHIDIALIALLNDGRPIASIWFDENRHIEVGSGIPIVTNLIPYMDGRDLFIAVVRNGFTITDRIPAWKVQVRYG